MRTTLKVAAIATAQIARRSRTAHFLAVNVAILASGLATSVFLGRILGPTGRGEVAAALLWPILLTVFSSFGLIPAIVYWGTGARDPANRVPITAFCLAALQSLIAVGVGYLAMPLFLSSQRQLVIDSSRQYLAVIPLLLLTNYMWSSLQAQLKLSTYNGLRLVTPAGYLIGTIILARSGVLSVVSVVRLQLGLAGLTFVLTALAFLALVRFELRFSRQQAKRLASYGARVQVGDLTRTANVQLDQVLITAWLPPAQLGLYTAAVSAGSLIHILGKAARPVLVAKLANAASADQALAELRVSGRRLVAAILLVMPLVLAAVPFALPWLYGSAYAGAVLPALVLVIASAVLAMTELTGGAAQALGNPWLTSRAEIWAFFLTVALLPPAIHYGGIVGAAVVSVVAYATQCFVAGRGLLSSSHRLIRPT